MVSLFYRYDSLEEVLTIGAFFLFPRMLVVCRLLSASLSKLVSVEAFWAWSENPQIYR